MDLNNLSVTGRLTRDVETKSLANGMEIAKFGLAVNSGKDEAIFFDCDVFGKQANTAQRFLRKGSRVAVSGRLSQQAWTSRDGQPKTKLCISVGSFAMLDPFKPKDEQQQFSTTSELTGEHDTSSPF